LIYLFSDKALKMPRSHSLHERVNNKQEATPLSHPVQFSRNLRLHSVIERYKVEKPQLSRVDHIKQSINKQRSSLSFIYCLNVLMNKIPLIRCLKEYNIRQNLFGDIISGITVAIMHIPQSKK
jgi:hypothetical protein